jgi:hypothetical protein
MNNPGRGSKYDGAGTTGRVGSSPEGGRKVARIQDTGVAGCLRAGRVQQLDLELAVVQQIPEGPAPDRRLLVPGVPISMLA